MILIYCASYSSVILFALLVWLGLKSLWMSYSSSSISNKTTSAPSSSIDSFIRLRPSNKDVSYLKVSPLYMKPLKGLDTPSLTFIGDYENIFGETLLLRALLLLIFPSNS